MSCLVIGVTKLKRLGNTGLGATDFEIKSLRLKKFCFVFIINKVKEKLDFSPAALTHAESLSDHLTTLKMLRLYSPVI